MHNQESRFEGTHLSLFKGNVPRTVWEKSFASAITGAEIPEDVLNEENFDVLITVLHAGFVNKLNANDEGISASTAAKIAKKFRFKPQNLEHSKKEVVGVTLDYAWADESGKILEISDDEVAKSEEVLSLVLIGAVWKYVNPKLAQSLFAAAQEGPQQHSIGASWEIVFDNYVILKGSRTIHGEGAEIISDPDEIKRLKPHLKKFKGTGFDPKDGKMIGRIIHDEKTENVLPVAIGYTLNPASNFKGIEVVDFTTEKDPEEVEYSKAKTSFLEKSAASICVKQKKQEENTKNVVIPNNIKFVMKIKELKQLIDLLPEESRASASEFVSEQLKIKAEEFEQQLGKKDKELSEATEQLGKLQTSVQTLTQELDQIKEESKAREAQEKFDLRMGAIDDEFQLSEDDQALVASEIKGLNDESYDKWFKKFSSFASEKRKSVIEERNAEITALKNKETSTASATPTAETSAATTTADAPATTTEDADKSEKLLDKLQELSGQSVANASPVANEDIAKSWGEAFAKSVKVTI